jgi:hypothetical protein
MEWPQSQRRKLARIVKTRSLTIQDEEFRKARGTLLTYGDVLEEVDRRILEELAPLGFTRANKDWELETHSDLMIFKDSPTHLWFETAQARIVKISKEQAEKLLVLGM